MEKAKPEVIYKLKAEDSIFQIFCYNAMQGYPERAEKFFNELYYFGNSLAVFPNSHPVCRQAILAKRNMRCALFHRSYVFIYKLLKNTLVIYNVISCKTNPAFNPI